MASVLNAVAAENNAVEHEEPTTEEQLSKRCMNFNRRDTQGGGVYGDGVDEGLMQLPQSCVKMLFDDIIGELVLRLGETEKQIENMVRLQAQTTKKTQICSKDTGGNVGSCGRELHKCV